MKTRGTAFLGGLLLLVGGCNGGGGRVYPPAYNPRAGADALAAYDANGNGLIDGVEFEKIPSLRAALGQVDADQDGNLTADEIDARVKAWQRTRIGEMPVRCEVTLDGEPLAEAVVTFEPESILGARVQAAAGRTQTDGTAGLSIAKELRSDPRYSGVACGWYRIREVVN